MFCVEKSRLVFSLFFSYLSLCQISLISYNYPDCVCNSMILKHLVPDFEILQCGFLGNIIDHDRTVGIFHVVRYETFEALLACSIPELYSKMFAVAGYILDVKVDAYSRLDRCRLTFSP